MDTIDGKRYFVDDIVHMNLSVTVRVSQLPNPAFTGSVSRRTALPTQQCVSVWTRDNDQKDA